MEFISRYILEGLDKAKGNLISLDGHAATD